MEKYRRIVASIIIKHVLIEIAFTETRQTRKRMQNESLRKELQINHFSIIARVLIE